MAKSALAILEIAVLFSFASCASGARVREFPKAPPVWKLEDRRPYSTPPEKVYSPYIWDALDRSLFEPISEFWLFRTKRTALDVNALDEVPDSSWFTNRMSTQMLSPDTVRQGACTDTVDLPRLPWTVVSGKPDGADPGFMIEDASGKRGLMKVDGTLQPERTTAADVIGALVFHAAGYFVPCNRIYRIRKDDLKLKPNVMLERSNGKVEPLSSDIIDLVLSKATEVGPGIYRVSVSEFIPGKPLGPWFYEGTRKDDPNDRIPHEHRRSNRAMKVLASWIEHIDTRQENTLLSWMKTSETSGYVDHYRIDFGDALGVIGGYPGIPERLGHSGYIDFGQATIDFLTLGLINHPWHDAKLGSAGLTLGYFAAEDFDPEAWKPGYPNPAFNQATEQDFAWMARIIARFTPAHIQAIVERARLKNSVAHHEIIRILAERRRRILERYLTRVSPLTWPRVNGRTLRLEDLLVSSGLRDVQHRNYRAWLFTQDRHVSLALDARPEGNHLELRLPDQIGPSEYAVVLIESQTQGQPAEYPLWIHLYAEPSGYFIAGLERPETRERPQWR